MLRPAEPKEDFSEAIPLKFFPTKKNLTESSP